MNLAGLIDHTFLKPNGTPNDIARLCREAKKYRFASVCVHPVEVARCARLLKGSGVPVCTVIGFPLGQNTPETILFEALAALDAGAKELDFVLNVGEFKAAKKVDAILARWTEIVRAVKRMKADAVTKLILECCYLTDKEKVAAAKMAKKAGFDFVKTSTGFGPGGATAPDVALLRKTVGKTMGVKAAGGIRTRADAEAMVKAGASRLGCSAGVAIVDSNSK